MGVRGTNQGESAGLYESDYPSHRRRAPVPGDPQTDQAITIGGAPAQLLNMQCPAGSGFLVELAVTLHDGTAFVFASQNPSGTGSQGADRAAFRAFLASIQFPR